MMWCSLIDLRFKTYAPNNEDDIRELSTMVIFKWLLEQSGQYASWSAIENFTRTFVGPTDSMTFAQFSDILNSNSLSIYQLTNYNALVNLESNLVSGQLGLQFVGVSEGKTRDHLRFVDH